MRRRLLWWIPGLALGGWVLWRLFSHQHVLFDIVLEEAYALWLRHAEALIPIFLYLGFAAFVIITVPLVWKAQKQTIIARYFAHTPLRILPSRTGWLFGAVLIVMQITAINFNLALGQMLVFLLGGLMLTSMFPAWRNQKDLRIAAEANPPPAFAGEAAHFSLRLDNPARHRRPGLVIHLLLAKLAENDTHLAVVHLAARSQQQVTLSVLALKRGWLALPPLLIESFYPLGFFRVWQHLSLDARCLIYPRPIFEPFPPLTEAEAQQVDDPKSTEGAADFAGFRRRTPADSMKHVAWKQAAKDESRPLLVAHLEGGQSGERRFAWAQTATLARDTETRFSILTGWVLQAAQANLAWSLSLPQEEIAQGTGPAHRQRCLEALALASP